MAHTAACPARLAALQQATPSGWQSLHKAPGIRDRTGPALLACCVRRCKPSSAVEAALAHADLQLLGASQVPVYVFGTLHAQAQVLLFLGSTASGAESLLSLLFRQPCPTMPDLILHVSCLKSMITELTAVPLYDCPAGGRLHYPLVAQLALCVHNASNMCTKGYSWLSHHCLPHHCHAMEVCGNAIRTQDRMPNFVHRCAAQAAVGEAILRARPSAVVVETAVNPAHGAATGNALCTDAHARLADAGLRRLCMAAAQLAAEPDPCASRLFAVRPSSMGCSCCCADACQGGRGGGCTRMWMLLSARLQII